jgi:hypothetical protein
VLSKTVSFPVLGYHAMHSLSLCPDQLAFAANDDVHLSDEPLLTWVLSSWHIPHHWEGVFTLLQ